MDDLSRELDDISIFTAEDEAELEQALEIQPTGVEDATVSSSKSKGIEIQTIQGQLVNESYAAEIWTMVDSYYIWMGTRDGPRVMENMCVAMKTRYDNVPLVNALVGCPDSASQQIAQRLSAKTGGKQVFVSCSLPPLPELISFVEKQIANVITIP